MSTREDLRNIAIIAHVDHGKTTLVDQMLRQSGAFRANQNIVDRVMDSNDLERERGITILAKNTAVEYRDVTINIVDTPGHADFGGEVERVLTMVDGAILLVDAFEGVMPQTRFVLQKALEKGHRIVVVVNKIDRDGARPQAVVDEIIDLFIALEADDAQLDFPVVFASARQGVAGPDPEAPGGDLSALFDAILSAVPAPTGDADAPLQMMFSSIDYNEYVGRIGIGRVARGVIRPSDAAVLCRAEGGTASVRVARLYKYEGLQRVEVEQASVGDIVAVAGVADLNIGDTICDPQCVEPLPFVRIDEPTLSMRFMVNDSPFAGREGKYVTSRHLRERLYREVLTNVSMHVADAESTEAFDVSGRGELHLSILIETMRREGYEFAVSRPKVIFRTDEDGRTLEPMERLTVDVPERYAGSVMEKLGSRKGTLADMQANAQDGVRLVFTIPARGLLGYRGEMLTDTRGNGVMSAVFDGYAPYKGDIAQRSRGSMVAHEAGESTAYGLYNAQERGKLFIGANTAVYEGMIVGENAKGDDIVVNVCRKKQMSNMRASGADEALRLIPHERLSLEKSIEFLAADEWLEVTPKSLRLRKSVLNNGQRAKKSAKHGA